MSCIALTVKLVGAVIVQDQVQMTFSASGYTGSVLVPLVFLPEIRYPGQCVGVEIA